MMNPTATRIKLNAPGGVNWPHREVRLGMDGFFWEGLTVELAGQDASFEGHFREEVPHG